jgi:hypothetical protein
MPQISPGGKYIFGWSLVSPNGEILIPPETMQEYQFKEGGAAILISGSKTSGGFSLGNQLMVEHPLFAALFTQYPFLLNHDSNEGQLFPYKGRLYGWVRVNPGGKIFLTGKTRIDFGVNVGDALLVIRGSNIAFDYAQRGPLIERARPHQELAMFSI